MSLNNNTLLLPLALALLIKAPGFVAMAALRRRRSEIWT